MSDLIPIRCPLHFPGDPPPDLSGFIDPVCIPAKVRIRWRDQEIEPEIAGPDVSGYESYTETLNPPQKSQLVAASEPTDSTPVPFLDDEGHPILNRNGKQMMRPAGLTPGFFVRRGLADAKREAALMADGMPEAKVAALLDQMWALWHFQRGHEWDSQRLGGSYREDFVDYATVAIGLYAAANGLSRDEILSIEDTVARNSHFREKTEMDAVYKHLPTRNVQNTDIGMNLYVARKITEFSE